MNNKLELMDQLEFKLKSLAEKVWKNEDVNISSIREWAEQFEEHDDVSQDERVQFLFLLTKYTYFGKKEVFFMLKTLYRDLFKYKVIREIRKANGDTLDENILNGEFNKTLSATRFLGIGNPSESGTFLLYKFRQINDISKQLFIHTHQIFSLVSEVDKQTGEKRQVTTIADPDIQNYIFIDDLTCTGTQAVSYASFINAIKILNPKAKVYYLVLVATKSAIEEIEKNSDFDVVDSVFKLDGSYKCFDATSRYYKNAESDFQREFTKEKCSAYDLRIQKSDFELGFDKSQLLISFEHNTPDNVPPVFWSNGYQQTAWKPIFPRFHKKY